MRTRHGHVELLEATGQHPFIRYELPEQLTRTWWQVDGAVGFRRVRHTGRTSLTLLGTDDGVTDLVSALPTVAAQLADGEAHRVVGQPPGGMRQHGGGRAIAVSVPQHLEPVLHQRFRVGQGGDWEWFYTTDAPAGDAAHNRVHALDDVTRAAEISAFLTEHSPTADTPPAGGERWFGIDSPAGGLAAVAAVGRTLAGAPHLSSVAVDTRLRGQGLGRAIVGALTRDAVAEHGVCTLGMYSHNEVGRALYLSLGYDNVCAWSSRAVVLTA